MPRTHPYALIDQVGILHHPEVRCDVVLPLQDNTPLRSYLQHQEVKDRISLNASHHDVSAICGRIIHEPNEIVIRGKAFIDRQRVVSDLYFIVFIAEEALVA